MPNAPRTAKPKRLSNSNSYQRKNYRYSAYDKNDIIYSRQWKNCKSAYLDDNPICQRCIYHNNVSKNSVINLSVHHIRMRNKYKDLAFDHDNLLTLCNACHNYFSSLETSGREATAIEQAQKVKTNIGIEKKFIAICGNVNTGKSGLMHHIKLNYGNVNIMAIDDYRRKYSDRTEQGEMIAQSHFINDLKKYNSGVIVCIGYGILWQSIKPYIKASILLECSTKLSLERFENTKEKVPLPDSWFKQTSIKESINAIKLYQDNQQYDIRINTDHCENTSDYSKILDKCKHITDMIKSDKSDNLEGLSGGRGVKK